MCGDHLFYSFLFMHYVRWRYVKKYSKYEKDRLDYHYQITLRHKTLIFQFFLFYLTFYY